MGQGAITWELKQPLPAEAPMFQIEGKNTMKILCLFIFVSLLFTVNPVWAKPFKAMSFPIIAEEKSMEARMIDEKRKTEPHFLAKKLFPRLVEGKKIEMISMAGKNYYQITENVTYFNGQVIEKTFLLETGEYLKSCSYKYLRKSPEGLEIETRELRMDNPSWNLNDDIYFKPMLGLVFRSFIENQSEKNTFHLWLNDMLIIPMKLKAMGKEQIHCPLGDFNCIKIRMEIDVNRIVPVKLLALFLKPMMPKFHFWLSENEPYPMLKSEIFSSPRAPKMYMEVTAFNNFQTID